MENKLNVRICKVHPNAVIPTYAKDGDMGMDLTAVSVEYDKEIDCFIYHTGLVFEVPKGYGMLVFPRSSNRRTNAYLSNSVGIADSGYRGEVTFCYKNRTEFDNKPPYKVGERVGQLVILPYPMINFEEVGSVDYLTKTDRGANGYGSSGK